LTSDQHAVAELVVHQTARPRVIDRPLEDGAWSERLEQAMVAL
jgi:hypothetical protein